MVLSIFIYIFASQITIRGWVKTCFPYFLIIFGWINIHSPAIGVPLVHPSARFWLIAIWWNIAIWDPFPRLRCRAEAAATRVGQPATEAIVAMGRWSPQRVHLKRCDNAWFPVWNMIYMVSKSVCFTSMLVYRMKKMGVYQPEKMALELAKIEV